MGRKWVYSHWWGGKFRRDRVFSKDCQKIIEMSEPKKGQPSVYQESDLLTKGSLRNKFINF